MKITIFKRGVAAAIFLAAALSAFGATPLAAQTAPGDQPCRTNDNQTDRIRCTAIPSNGQPVEIDRHGFCRRIINNSGQTLMIPHHVHSGSNPTMREWHPSGGRSFSANMPSGVTETVCIRDRTVTGNAHCSNTFSSTRTVQSYFSSSDWTSDKHKILTIPSGCNMCRSSSSGHSMPTLTMGSTPWGGELTIVVNGAITAGVVGNNRTNSQRNIAIDVNRRGDSNQRANIIVNNGGRIIGGGRHGSPGNWGNSYNVTGRSCWASFGNCNCTSHQYSVLGGSPGQAGTGEHCGAAPTAGTPGSQPPSVQSRQDTCWCFTTGSPPRQQCQAQMGTGWHPANPGTAGSPGIAATQHAIRNRNNANITVNSGGHVRGL